MFARSMAALCLLAATACCQEAAASDPYSDAYREAQTSGKLLIVTVGVDGPMLADPARFVACRLPKGFEWSPGDSVGSKGLAARTGLNEHQQPVLPGASDRADRHIAVRKPRAARAKLAEHPSLAQLDGRGAFIVTFPDGQGRVIAVLPARYCSADGLWALVNLPADTITSNALIWAVRMHPECPKSADGYQDYRLGQRATLVSQTQAANGRSGHPVPWPADVCEVATESWPENTNVVDAAVDLVATWRRSPGHWAAVRAPNRGYGYDMAVGFNHVARACTWFGTGCFKN